MLKMNLNLLFQEEVRHQQEIIKQVEDELELVVLGRGEASTRDNKAC